MDDTSTTTTIGFHKYEGLGNDFVIIEATREDQVPIAVVRQLCDRRLGIGADGVLLVLPPTTAGADGRMRVINADGSIPEMCGNGLRCVALHVARSRSAKPSAKPDESTEGRSLKNVTLTFDTDAGTKSCAVNGSDVVTVDMGPVKFIQDVSLDLSTGGGGGDAWDFALGDAGNPHAITKRSASRSEIDTIGPRVATHARFPNGTNVEFATQKSPTEIDLIVWERGVGITQACGTGACATAAVFVAKGWSPSDTDIAVNLLGGTLTIRIESKTGHAIMRGPARCVFSGTAQVQVRTS